MNSILDVNKAIKNATTSLQLTKTIWYTVNNNPNISISIRKPEPFDNYLDVIARVTLYYDGAVVWDVLITLHSDLERFCDKLKKKIKTIEINQRKVASNG
jgi:hypothetical protein